MTFFNYCMFETASSKLRHYGMENPVMRKLKDN